MEKSEWRKCDCSIFDFLSEAIFIQDLNGIILYANKAAFELTGYSQDELIGQNFKLFYADDESSRIKFEAFLSNCIDTNKPISFKFKGRCKNGEVRHTECLLKSGTYDFKDVLFISSRDVTIETNLTSQLEKNISNQKQINDLLTSFKTNYDHNIISLLKMSCDLLHADCAMFSHIEAGKLIVDYKWNTPDDLPQSDDSEGHICTKIITTKPHEIIHLKNLSQTEFYKSDKYVRKYNINSYIGSCVVLHGDFIGSFCILFSTEFTPDEPDLSAIKIISAAISSELAKYESAKKIEHANLELLKKTKVAIESEKIATGLIDQSPISIQICDKYGLTEKLNRAWETMWLVDKSIVEGKFNVLTNSISKLTGWADLIKPSFEGLTVVVKDKPFNPSLISGKGRERIVNVVSFPIILDNRLEKVVIMSQDITDYNRIEKELVAHNIELEHSKLITEQNEKKYSSILENSFDLIALFNMDFKCIYCNNAFEKVVGYKGEEFIGKSIYDILDNDFSQQFKSSLEHYLAEEKDCFEILGKIISIDKKHKWIEHRFKMIENSYNHEKILLLNAVDVTEKIAKDNFLKIQRNLAYSIIDCKSFGDFFRIIKNELSTLIDSENICFAYFDSKRGIFKAEEFYDKFDKIDEWSADKSLCGLVMKKNHSILLREDEIETLNKTGEISYIGHKCKSWIGTPVHSSLGPLGIFVIQSYDSKNAFDSFSLEIIELIAKVIRIFLEKRLAEESHTKLSKAIMQSPSSVIICNKNGIIEYVNPKFCQVTGYSFDEIVGKKPSVLRSGYHDKRVFVEMWERISSGSEWRGELLNKKKNGELYWEDVSISPIISDNGQITHYVSVKEDITERKNMIDEIINAKERAEESDRLKSAFLQNISHEIRTPMNGILGFIDLLQDDDLSKDQQKSYFKIIENSSNRMLSTINNIIDISKIEAGIANLNIDTFDIKNLIQELISFYTAEANKKNLHLKFLFDQEVIDWNIESDYEKIYAIFSNLIKNSLKYTNEGYICIRLKQQNEDIVIFVEDTGIGIPKDKFEKIFERFVQVNDNLTILYEGAGLGLSIVKAYIQLIKGDIKLESEPGKGTTFFITIPKFIKHKKLQNGN